MPIGWQSEWGTRRAEWLAGAPTDDMCPPSENTRDALPEDNVLLSDGGGGEEEEAQRTLLSTIAGGAEKGLAPPAEEEEDGGRNLVDGGGPKPSAEFDYEAFLRRMRHPACRPIVTRTKEFIQRLRRQPPPSTSQLVHQYRDYMDASMEMIRENPVWRLMGDVRPGEYELAREGMEYLLTNQLHGVLFAPPEDRDRDAQIERKIILYADWLQPCHLDLPAGVKGEEEALRAAVTQFCRVNEYVTPRDKLICLFNGCRHLQHLVEALTLDAGADELLPVLIFALLKSRIAQLHSNLQYISRFRDGRVLAGERGGYLFTGLLAASTFIEGMEQQSLLVGEQEYAERMEEGMMRLNARTLDEQEAAASVRACVGLEEAGADRGRAPPPPPLDPETGAPLSPDARLREEATRLYHNVKEKVKLGASKSFDYLGKLMDEAEAQIKAAINSGDATPQVADPQTDRALKDEDEFQLQLAMALSLSEQEFLRQQQGQNGGGSPGQPNVSLVQEGGEPTFAPPSDDAICSDLAGLDLVPVAADSQKSEQSPSGA